VCPLNAIATRPPARSAQSSRMFLMVTERGQTRSAFGVADASALNREGAPGSYRPPGVARRAFAIRRRTDHQAMVVHRIPNGVVDIRDTWACRKQC
jgi:phage terminase large subunit-like protein